MASATPMNELMATTNLQNEVSKLSMQTTIQRANLVQEARSNLVAQVEEAKTKYNEIMSKENSDLQDIFYNGSKKIGQF